MSHALYDKQREAKLALAVVHSFIDIDFFQILQERGVCSAANVNEDDKARSWLLAILNKSSQEEDDIKKEQSDNDGLTIVTLLLDETLTTQERNACSVWTTTRQRLMSWAEAFQAVEDLFPTPFDFDKDDPNLEIISKLELLLHMSMELQKRHLLGDTIQTHDSNLVETIEMKHETKSDKSKAVESKGNVLQILTSLMEADDVETFIKSQLQNDKFGDLSEEQKGQVMGYCQCISQEYQVRKDFMMRNFELTKLAFQKNEKAKKLESSNASTDKGRSDKEPSRHSNMEDTIQDIGERVTEKLHIENIRQAVQHGQLNPDSFLIPSTLSNNTSYKSTMRNVTIQSNVGAPSVQDDDRHAMPDWEEGKMKPKRGKFKRGGGGGGGGKNHSKSKSKSNQTRTKRH